MPEDRPASGWTIDTLAWHSQEMLDAHEKLLNQRIDAARDAAVAAQVASTTAIIKAEEANTKRFESVNEFRAALQDASKNNISRQEVEQRIIDQRATFETQIAAANDKIIDLGARMNRADIAETQRKGNKEGMLNVWKALVAILGVMVGALAIIAAFKHW
jgi:hypothetical protein